jgi:hypothetical protein
MLMWKEYCLEHRKGSELLDNQQYIHVWYQDISGPGHLGTEHMRHLGARYWTSRYSVLEISVLNNKNNLIVFKNFFNFFFTCRRCLHIFLCVFFF